MHADMAFIEMGDNRIRERTWVFRLIDTLWIDRLFADQDSDAGTLWLIVLAGNI